MKKTLEKFRWQVIFIYWLSIAVTVYFDYQDLQWEWAQLPLSIFTLPSSLSLVAFIATYAYIERYTQTELLNFSNNFYEIWLIACAAINTLIFYLLFARRKKLKETQFPPPPPTYPTKN